MFDWTQMMHPMMGQRFEQFQNRHPAFNPQMGGHGAAPMRPFTGGGLRPQPTDGGYDSSGINPHGMYNGTFGQPQFPHNPGGFQPMGLPQLMRFNQQPSGLAALFAR